MKIKYSISMWNYEAYTQPVTLEEAVAEAWRSGYGVEVWPNWKSDRNMFDIENRERLVRMLKGVPSSLHSGIEVRTLEHNKVQIDAARDTGSPVIVVHTSNIGLAGEGAAGISLARDVAAYAKENGVRIALENGGANALDVLKRAIEELPDIGICLDIGHVYDVHDHPLKDYLQRLESRIIHLHLQDVYMVPGTKRAKNDSHRTPGMCDIPVSDWQQLFKTLKKINFSGFGVFEVRPFTPDETAAQAIEFLESISG